MIHALPLQSCYRQLRLQTWNSYVLWCIQVAEYCAGTKQLEQVRQSSQGVSRFLLSPRGTKFIYSQRLFWLIFETNTRNIKWPIPRIRRRQNYLGTSFLDCFGKRSPVDRVQTSRILATDGYSSRQSRTRIPLVFRPSSREVLGLNSSCSQTFIKTELSL